MKTTSTPSEDEICQRFRTLMEEKLADGLDPLTASFVTLKQAERDLGAEAVPVSLRKSLRQLRDTGIDADPCSGLSTNTEHTKK